MKLKPVDSAKREAVMRDVRAGKLSIEEIGEKHGVKANTIRTWKRRDKANEPPPPQQEPAQETASFAMDNQQIPPEQMPDFGPVNPPEAASAPPAGGGQSPPPPASPGSPADAIMWKELVSLASTGFDKTVQQMIGEQEGKPVVPQRPDPISKDDQAKLAEAIHAAFVAYGGNLAEFLAKWGPLINLTVVTGAVFLPRIFQARDYIKHQKKIKADEAAARAKLAAAQPPTSPLASAIRTDEPETALGDQLARRFGQVQA